jgi:type I restriction enzyme S subunit
MEVNSGYKRTEVGLIPADWEVAPLGKVVERLEAGVSVNSVDEGLRSYGHEQAILKTSAIAGGQFLPHESKKIAPRDIRRARLNPRADTIIISRMNTPDLVGECGYVISDFPNLFLPDRLWMTHCRRSSQVSVRWLNYLLTRAPYKSRIKGLATGTSGSMKNIAKDALLAMPIAYPDGDEQRAIADVLRDVDRAGSTYRQETRPTTGSYAATPHRQNTPPWLPR